MSQQIETRRYHCCGCGRPIPWDGTGLFSYTCRCGATIFADQNHKPAFPASLIIAIHEKREIPHIDYYLGFSNYVSVEKQALYEEFRKLGCLWSWECSRCKDRFLERKRMQIKEGFLHIELHPELQKFL